MANARPRVGLLRAGLPEPVLGRLGPEYHLSKGARVPEGPKPYKYIWFGDIHGPKPYKCIGFGDIHGPKSYDLIGFGDIHGPKPYKFIGFGDWVFEGSLA